MKCLIKNYSKSNLNKDRTESQKVNYIYKIKTYENYIINSPIINNDNKNNNNNNTNYKENQYQKNVEISNHIDKINTIQSPISNNNNIFQTFKKLNNKMPKIKHKIQQSVVLLSSENKNRNFIIENMYNKSNLFIRKNNISKSKDFELLDKNYIKKEISCKNIFNLSKNNDNNLFKSNKSKSKNKLLQIFRRRSTMINQNNNILNFANAIYNEETLISNYLKYNLIDFICIIRQR